MRFLVDAQLPVRLARQLARSGHDTRHTSELPDGNRTSDAEITRVADAEDRVVVTKDRDFRTGHLVHASPRRVLLVVTGNVSNDDLLALFDRHLDVIVGALDEVRFVELGPEQIVLHDDR